MALFKNNKTSVNAANAKRKANIEGVEIANKSQIGSDIYYKLKKEKRLERFLGLIQELSIEGIDIEQSIDIILESMPGYIRADEFDVSIFQKLLEEHSDVAAAWGFGRYGDRVSNRMIKNRATELAIASEVMSEIKIYKEIYDTVSNTPNSENSQTVFKFELTKDSK